MISSKDFLEKVNELGNSFFTGVPDSLLKDFCAYVQDNVDEKSHVITANEGGALSLAVGNYLATGKTPLVYLQNSGLGNIVNPLLSLVDQMVYQIPVVLLIGWRGEPGKKDEPQHQKQGAVTPDLLEAMKIPYKVLSSLDDITWAYEEAKNCKGATCLLVKKGTFESYKSNVEKINDENIFGREEAIVKVSHSLNKQDIVLSTTGKISRELYEFRVGQEQPCNDFYNVGSMGYVSQISMGIALEKPEKRIICLDGDGAFMMHLGNLALVGKYSLENYYHIVLNNQSHESVGGQPTVNTNIDLSEIAKNLGFKNIFKINNKSEFDSNLENFLQSKGPSFLEIMVGKGSRKDLGRQKESPVDNKLNFLEHINE